MRLRIAATWPARLRGLIGRHEGWLGPDGVLLIVPCASIHTFLMRRRIDIAFIDSRGTVLEAAEGLPPGRLHSCRGSVAALERFTPVTGEGVPWLRPGERVGIVPEETHVNAFENGH